MVKNNSISKNASIICELCAFLYFFAYFDDFIKCFIYNRSQANVSLLKIQFIVIKLFTCFTCPGSTLVNNSWWKFLSFSYSWGIKCF